MTKADDPVDQVSLNHSENRSSPTFCFGIPPWLVFGRKKYHRAGSNNESTPLNHRINTTCDEENNTLSTKPLTTAEEGHDDEEGSSDHSTCHQQKFILFFLALFACTIFIASIKVLVLGVHNNTDITIKIILVLPGDHNNTDIIDPSKPVTPCPKCTHYLPSYPTMKPSSNPSLYPTVKPTSTSSFMPSVSLDPTIRPTSTHSTNPTSKGAPSLTPTSIPTFAHSSTPSSDPTTPASTPTFTPVSHPAVTPTSAPTFTPHSFVPSSNPFTLLSHPTVKPSIPTHTFTPSKDPTVRPTFTPSKDPSLYPTTNPTITRVNDPLSSRPTQSPTISLAPVIAYPTIPLRPKISSLALGRSHSCAITTYTKDLLCLGNNDRGQLGDGTILSRNTPAIISLGNNTYATHIAAEVEITCAITNIGELKCWGRNKYGNIGDGTKEDRRTPKTISLGGTDTLASQIALGPHHTCAITNTNELLCWGANDYSQIGVKNVNEVGNRVTKPTIILSPDTNDFFITKVDLGGYHTCAITNTKTLLCWGRNEHGQLGDGTTVDKAEPVTISLGTDSLGTDRFATGISLGYEHTCVITNTEELLCWGCNEFAQLGDGTKEDSYSPKTISLVGFATDISLGVYHTCAITNTNALKCWGWNHYGELGDGTKEIRLRPTTIPSLSTPNLFSKQVALGWHHTCTVTNSNEAQCWGDNEFGKLGDGTRKNRSIPSLAFGGG